MTQPVSCLVQLRTPVAGLTREPPYRPVGETLVWWDSSTYDSAGIALTRFVVSSTSRLSSDSTRVWNHPLDNIIEFHVRYALRILNPNNLDLARREQCFVSKRHSVNTYDTIT